MMLFFNSNYYRDEIEKWFFISIFITTYLIFLYVFYWFSWSEPCHPNYKLLLNGKKSQWESKLATTGGSNTKNKSDIMSVYEKNDS